MKSLREYRSNVYSQNGEDGVVAELCRRLGRQASEQFYRLLKQGWTGVYIEGNRERFNDLKANMAPFAGRVTTLNALVSPQGDQRLDLPAPAVGPGRRA